MGGATAGSNRRLNLWSKTTSGLISAPPLMILAGQFYISETAGSFFFFSGAAYEQLAFLSLSLPNLE